MSDATPEPRDDATPERRLSERSESKPPPPHHAHHALHVQLARFVWVGALAALVDFGLLVALMHLGWGHNPAKAVSFVAGTTTAYLLNRVWTFRAAHSHRRLLAVLALYAATFAVQVGLFAVLYPWLDHHHGRLAAQVVGFVVAQGVATAVNFVVQRTVIFRPV